MGVQNLLVTVKRQRISTGSALPAGASPSNRRAVHRPLSDRTLIRRPYCAFSLIKTSCSCAHEEFSGSNFTKGKQDAFNKQTKRSGCDWIHFTLASRNSDSDFAPDLFAAGLHIRILGAGSWGRGRFCEDKGNTYNIKST